MKKSSLALLLFDTSTVVMVFVFKFLRRGTSEPLETHFILWKTKVSLSCLSKLYFLEYLDYVWKNDFDFVHVLLRAVQRQDVQSSMQRYKAW